MSGLLRRIRRLSLLGSLGIGLILAFQIVCAAVFIGDILSSLLGLRSTPMNWQLREMLELAAAFGLLTGLGLGAYALRLALRQRNAAEARLQRAAGAFADLLEMRFAEWRLSPAERDVALFAIKGLSTAEIALLRGTSEGTVKAQTAAVYRKAGVNGRPQLLSLFIEDLFDPVAPAPGPDTDGALANIAASRPLRSP